ncbi:MAG: hypothetical protein HQL69_02150 [Magnetococcales bacterium]|nr:hypothetical protein [Magnetococcales bacterium]
MIQQDSLLRFSTWSSSSTAILIMIPLVAATVIVANDLHADSSKTKENGTQKLGKQMGSFMNSFMEGLDEQQNAKPEGPQKPKGVAKNRSLNSRRNVYDPWGARGNRYNRAYRYDPWGATKDTRGLGRFADRDWALSREYYGVGSEPWRNGRGSRGYYNPYYDPGYQNWDRRYESNWPESSYGYPYDGYGRSESDLRW